MWSSSPGSTERNWRPAPGPHIVAPESVPDRAAAPLQGFRFSPTSAAPRAAEAKDAACVGEKEVLRLFRRMGGEMAAGEPTIARDDFVRSLRKSPEVAAALGVPTDLKAEEALTNYID